MKCRLNSFRDNNNNNKRIFNALNGIIILATNIQITTNEDKFNLIVLHCTLLALNAVICVNDNCILDGFYERNESIINDIISNITRRIISEWKWKRCSNEFNLIFFNSIIKMMTQYVWNRDEKYTRIFRVIAANKCSLLLPF